MRLCLLICLTVLVIVNPAQAAPPRVQMNLVMQVSGFVLSLGVLGNSDVSCLLRCSDQTLPIITYGGCFITLDGTYRFGPTDIGGLVEIDVHLADFATSDGARFPWQSRVPRRVDVRCTKRNVTPLSKYTPTIERWESVIATWSGVLR